MWSSCSLSSPTSTSWASFTEVVRLRMPKVTLRVAVAAEDRLRHQQLVEVRVEHRADDRVDLPGVVVDAGGDVGHGALGRCQTLRVRHHRLGLLRAMTGARVVDRYAVRPAGFDTLPRATCSAPWASCIRPWRRGRECPSPSPLHRGVVVEVELAIDDAPVVGIALGGVALRYGPGAVAAVLRREGLRARLERRLVVGRGEVPGRAVPGQAACCARPFAGLPVLK